MYCREVCEKEASHLRGGEPGAKIQQGCHNDQRTETKFCQHHQILGGDLPGGLGGRTGFHFGDDATGRRVRQPTLRDFTLKWALPRSIQPQGPQRPPLR